MSPVQGKSPLVHAKEPYSNLDMATLGVYSNRILIKEVSADNRLSLAKSLVTTGCHQQKVC